MKNLTLIISMGLILSSCENEVIINTKSNYKILDFRHDKKDTLGDLLTASAFIMMGDINENVTFINDTICIMNDCQFFKIEKDKLYIDNDTFKISKERDKLYISKEKDTLVLQEIK